MTALNQFLTILEQNRCGNPLGICSVCSAHPDVVRSSIVQARDDDSLVLIESTSNQVDQFGGYTGMKPADFAAFVMAIADEESLPRDRILLGGDHLGPNAWQDKPAEQAMALAEALVATYVRAGFLKIHLDASMYCADDEGDRHQPLDDATVAERAARLCVAAEAAWAQAGCDGDGPVYVIGTEVPVPGGVVGDEQLRPTSASDAARTIEVTRSAFESAGLHDAWSRVIGLVVQPGVEYGDDEIFHYERTSAAELSRMTDRHERIVYEAHSTDFQTEQALRQLVEDHFCILKVGPWLTFAYREALFALESIERELVPDAAGTRSGLSDVLESVMTDDPKHWQKYYSGTPEELAFKRRFSLSDRSRYYWTHPRLTAAVTQLRRNLDQISIPVSLLSQYLPRQFDRVLDWRISATASDLIADRVRDVLRKYARACGFAGR